MHLNHLERLKYLQQLAIITPYAQLELEYHNHANPKKDLTAVYRRRSEQMPPLAYEVKHHPGSVNNLLVQQLIHRQATHGLGHRTGNRSAPSVVFKAFRTRILRAVANRFWGENGSAGKCGMCSELLAWRCPCLINVHLCWE